MVSDTSTPHQILTHEHSLEYKSVHLSASDPTDGRKNTFNEIKVIIEIQWVHLSPLTLEITLL